jgi:hypothetical protein
MERKSKTDQIVKEKDDSLFIFILIAAWPEWPRIKQI